MSEYQMASWGLLVKWTLTVPYVIDTTDTDKALKAAKGFMGYDERSPGWRYYFYASPEARAVAMRDCLSASEVSVLTEGVTVLPEQIIFNFEGDGDD